MPQALARVKFAMVPPLQEHRQSPVLPGRDEAKARYSDGGEGRGSANCAMGPRKPIAPRERGEGMTILPYVVQTKPGQERAASRRIEATGIEIFLPTFIRFVSIGRRREPVIRPLYPLYLFALFDVDDLEQKWRGIFRVDGVQTILPINGHAERAGKVPIPVPKFVVSGLKAIAAANGGHIPIEQDDVRSPFARLVPGQRVLVNEGPFDGLSGLVDRDQKERVWVLLDILGGQVPTMLPREALSAA